MPPVGAGRLGVSTVVPYVDAASSHSISHMSTTVNFSNKQMTLRARRNYVCSLGLSVVVALAWSGSVALSSVGATGSPFLAARA